MIRSRWRSIYYFRLSLCLCLISTFIGCNLAKRQAATIKTVAQRPVDPISGPNFDLWFNGFFDNPPLPPVAATKSEILSAFKIAKASNGDEWIQKSISKLTERFSRSYPNPKDYLALAQSLYDARNEVRTSLPVDDARIAIFVLDRLAQEMLYAAELKFPGLPNQWTWDGQLRSDCKDSLAGFKICPGDIAISKSPMFSASVFRFRTLYSSTFSHAAVAFIGKSGLLRFSEADHGGRSTFAPDRFNGLPRVSIYRYSKGDLKPAAAVRNGILRLPKFQFNYSLDPKCGGDSYFCTQMIYCGFKQAGMTGAENPYWEKLWGAPSKLELTTIRRFIARVTDINWGKAPLPGDVELNPNYVPVFHSIKLRWIPEMRIREAIITALIQLMNTNSTLREKFINSLSLVAKNQRRLASVMDKATYGQFLRIKQLAQGRVRPEELILYSEFQLIVVPQLYSEIEQEVGNRPIPPSALEAMALRKLKLKLNQVIQWGSRPALKQ